MSDGMGREPAYLSSHATNRYFIPNWGIYIAQERRKWPLRAEAPPPALLGEVKNPSPILRDGLGMGSGRKAAREQANFSCKPGNRTATLE